VHCFVLKRKNCHKVWAQALVSADERRRFVETAVGTPLETTWPSSVHLNATIDRGLTIIVFAEVWCHSRQFIFDIPVLLNCLSILGIRTAWTSRNVAL
jgi:hypothetical protein